MGNTKVLLFTAREEIICTDNNGASLFPTVRISKGSPIEVAVPKNTNVTNFFATTDTNLLEAALSQIKEKHKSLTMHQFNSSYWKVEEKVDDKQNGTQA